MAGAAPPAPLAASAPAAALPDGSSPHRPARPGGSRGRSAPGRPRARLPRRGRRQEERCEAGRRRRRRAVWGCGCRCRCSVRGSGLFAVPPDGGGAWRSRAAPAALPHPPAQPGCNGGGRGEGAAGEAAPPGLPRSAGPLPKRRGAPQPRGGRCRPGAGLRARGGLQLLPARPSLRNPT